MSSQGIKECILINSYGITDIGLTSLATIHSLQELNLSGCLNLTSSGVQALGSLTNLITLDLSFIDSLTDEALLPVLPQLSHLQVLDISFCSNLTDAVVAVICTSCSKLTSLNLHGCSSITDANLDQLSLLSQLNDLNLSAIALTDRGVAHLTALPLQQLYLRGCLAVSNASGALVSVISTLQFLDISFTYLGDPFLNSLSHARELEVLWLGDCSLITATGLAARQGLTKLKQLHLSGCTSNNL